MRQPAPTRPRRVRVRTVEAGASHERWLVSYADFITLMFAFFLMMYASSQVDAKKMKTIVASLGDAFHPRRLTTTASVGEPGVGNVALPGSASGHADLRVLEAQLRSQFATPIANQQLDIEYERRGLVISIREAGSFAVGSADLPETTQALLMQLGDATSRIENPLRVEGHTDDVPIHTARFASNWELSTARATNVVAFFLSRTGIRPDRVSASGYGEFHPRVPNVSDGNRAHNRRVDFVILNPATEGAEEPSPANVCK